MVKNFFITFIIFFSIIQNLKGQEFYKDEYIEIKGYFNYIDSSVNLRISNVSETSLLLNSKEPLYFFNNGIHVAELALIRNGVSLLQPGPGEIMYFKRLLPRNTWTITIDKYTGTRSNFDSIQSNFLLEFQYIVLKNDLYINDGITNSALKQFVVERKLTFFDKSVKLKIPVKNDSNCLQILKPY